MRLTVLSVAYPLAPVGPDAVGGAEQVLGHLDAALMRAGQQSIVVACAGSVTAGTLVATPAASGMLTDEVRRRVQAQHRRAIAQALVRWPVDVVHMHGIDFYTYLPLPGVPVLVTLHLPPAWYPPEVFRLPRPRTYLHCVSTAQRRACPPGALLWPTIDNGVPVAAGRPPHAKRRFALMLGRICPEKGFHLGLGAAARVNIPALLAGEVFRYEAHERYFAQEIAPRLDGARRFIGPLGLARKRRLLAAARCLLVPSLAPETSSLVAMEALAHGTPVIAFPAGALPDIVEHGKTGFLVRDAQEMADAIEAAGALDAEVCRDTARALLARQHDGTVCGRLPAPGRRGMGRAGKGWGRAGLGIPRARRNGERSARSRVVNPEAAAALEIEEVTTTAGLERLRAEWSALWARCPAATPFQSPEWLIPWWRHIGAGELWTLALRRAGRLVGLAPLYIYVAAGSAERQVLLVGIATSDYLDALFDGEFAAGGAAAVLAHLDAARERWDVCNLQALQPGSPLLGAELPGGWQEEVSVQDACPMLTLPATLEALPGVVPHRLLRNLRYYWRRAEKYGPGRVEHADEANLDDLLEALFHLHSARWSSRGGAGVLAPEAVRKAHRETAPGLLSLGILRLYGLRLGDRIVAGLYGFTHTTAGKTRAYAYVSGFDPAFERLSAGTLIMGQAVREAVREGAAAFDFLRGREPYKYLWGAKDRVTYRRRLWHAAGR